MAIEIISGETAWACLQRNKTGNWPSRQMADKLYPIATPLANASFKIEKHEKIFCIGSCFAREIGQALQRLNFQVLSQFDNLPKSQHRKKSDVSMFNKYNVASIYNELYWALYPKEYHHDSVLIETNDKRLEDYQLSGSSYSDEPLSAKHFRDVLNQAFQNVKQANIVILTLGLSEVWFDKQTNLYLNVAASRELLKLYPNRFEVHIFDYEQTLKILNDIYALLQKHLPADFRLLITVSPIPLYATFRAQDILVANTYSKAVLRCAIDAFIFNKTNVNYFPSYEFVTLSNPSVLWREDDFRHVDRSMIDYIMGNVMAQFTTPSPELNQANALAKATALYQGNFFNEAIKTLEPFIKQKESRLYPQIILLWSAVRLRLHGKYKLLAINGVRYLREKTDIKLWHIVRDTLRGYRHISNSAFIGYIEQWNGEQLMGWACCLEKNTPLKLNIVINKKVIKSIIADEPRADVAAVYGDNCMRCGFKIMLNYAELNSDTLHIIFADTGRDVPNSPVLLSDYNKARLNV